MICEPLEEFLQPCDNFLKRTVARCFSVAFNLTSIYRGCYELEDPFIQHCADTRLSRCAVCEGNGCNNQPLFQPPSNLTCKHCPYGVCGAVRSETRADFHTCGRFLMTIVPSCYQIIDYAMVAFTFGCSNDLSANDFQFCSLDTLHLSCRFCYTANCNDAAHRFRGHGNNRKRCQASISTYFFVRYCDRFTILTPFAHCFVEVNFMRPRLGQFVGCTSSYPQTETEQVVRGVNFYNCWDSECNDIMYIKGGRWMLFIILIRLL